MKFRRLNKLKAETRGYFWTACPLCGQMFGGHEWKTWTGGHDHSIPTDRPGNFTAICPDCGDAGKGCKAHIDATKGLSRDDARAWYRGGCPYCWEQVKP